MPEIKKQESRIRGSGALFRRALTGGFFGILLDRTDENALNCLINNHSLAEASQREEKGLL